MNILCFDVESNGLHGEAFAVAGILLAPDGSVLSKTALRAGDEHVSPLDPWVAKNVIPAMKTMHANCTSRWMVRDRFWRWFTYSREAGPAITIVDCGWPVEANLLSQCIADDPTNRAMSGPYPLHELATLLLAVERDPTGSCAEWLGDEANNIQGVPHDPRYDAELSARAALKAMRILGRSYLGSGNP